MDIVEITERQIWIVKPGNNFINNLYKPNARVLVMGVFMDVVVFRTEFGKTGRVMEYELQTNFVPTIETVNDPRDWIGFAYERNVVKNSRG